MSLDPGDAFVLDSEDATVVDVITVTQGSGEDAESWPLRLIEIADEELLIEEYSGKWTLYERDGSGRDPVHVKEDDVVRYAWEAGGRSDSGRYVEGTAADGRDVLHIDGQRWIEDDALVPAGIDGEWRARGHTLASDLRQAGTPQPEEVSSGAPLVDLGFAAAFTGYIAAALFFGAPGFRWVWWVCGLLALAGSRSSPRFGFHRTARIVGFAFGLWLVTDMAYHLAPEPVAGGWDMGRALFFLAAAWPPYLLHRRTFHMVTDAAVGAAVASIVVFGGLFLFWAFIDEDLSWLASWGWYFGKPAYAWLWPAFFVGALFKYRKDYLDAPLDAAAYAALRIEVVRQLRSGGFEDDLLSVGRQIDDLADALRLCDDPAVMALMAHRPALEAAAKAFEESAGKGWLRLSAAPDDVAELVRADARTLADDLEAMAAGSGALRVSPALRWKTISG